MMVLAATRPARCVAASQQQLALALSYDGTDFHGWTDVRDSTLRPALAQLLRTEVDRLVLSAASRTDAGVHAAGQVCAVPLERPLARADVGQLMYSLNQLLPVEVAVHRAALVPAHFDVRTNTGKVYAYRLSAAAVRDPLSRRHRWHLPPRHGRPWCAEAAAEAAGLLLGTHDFSAFGNRPRGRERSAAVAPVMTLRELRLERGADDAWTFRVEGDRFLYKQVRNLVGSLALVGQGRLSASDLAHALEHGVFPQGESTPITAPAHGLTLQRVLYGEGEGPFDIEAHVSGCYRRST